MKNIICRKCAGLGKIANFKHVEDGICFTCQGSKFETVDDSTTDIIQLIREERKLSKLLEKEFDLIYGDHKSKMPNPWIHYIRETTNISSKLIRLHRYLNYEEEKKIRVKGLDIQSENFLDEFEALQHELIAIFMLDDE